MQNADASVTEAYVRLDSMETSVLPVGSVCMKTSTAGTESSLTVTFPTAFTVDSNTAHWTLDTTANNIPQGTTQWASTGSGNATTVSGQAVTFTVGDLTANTLTCLHFTATGTSSTGSAGNDEVGSLATDVDATAYDYALSIVATGGEDVSVNATVSPTFSYSLSPSTSVSFNSGNPLVVGTVYSASTTLTIGTNAASGWISWVENSANGLYNSVSATSISNLSYGSTTTLSGANYGYGLDADSGSGSPTIDTAYDGATANDAGGMQNAFKLMASKTPGPANSDTVTLNFRSRINAAQAPGSYSDLVTVLAAGAF